MKDVDIVTLFRGELRRLENKRAVAVRRERWMEAAGHAVSMNQVERCAKLLGVELGDIFDNSTADEIRSLGAAGKET